MDKDQFKARWEEIAGKAATLHDGADAFKDTGHAALCKEAKDAKWTQRETASLVGISQQHVGRLLMLYRYVSLTPAGCQTLTERCFRAAWDKTNGQGKEPERFAIVAKILAEIHDKTPEEVKASQEAAITLKNVVPIFVRECLSDGNVWSGEQLAKKVCEKFHDMDLATVKANMHNLTRTTKTWPGDGKGRFTDKDPNGRGKVYRICDDAAKFFTVPVASREQAENLYASASRTIKRNCKLKTADISTVELEIALRDFAECYKLLTTDVSAT